jgi:predicted acylesterase/phospholipase RssA
LVTSEPILFRSVGSEDTPADAPMLLVARATSAAPTFFPPIEFEWNGSRRIFIDGGVVANNPAMVGLSEALRMRSDPSEVTELLSLGTGLPDRQAPQAAQLAAVGKQSWFTTARGVIEIMFTGTSEMTHTLLHSLGDRTSTEVRYVRIQASMGSVSRAMDDASPTHVHALVDVADRLVESERPTLDQVAGWFG